MAGFFFNFQSMITIALFLICTCSYVRHYWPSLIEPYKDGFFGFLRRAAVIGDRLSPWVSAACFTMSLATIFYRE